MKSWYFGYGDLELEKLVMLGKEGFCTMYQSKSWIYLRNHQ
jgi:hypothetical protein